MDGIDKAGGASDVAWLRPTSATVTTAQTAAAQTAAAADSSTTDTAAAANSTNLISLLADAAPPVDSKKVQAIQSLIASGAYPIDAHTIAAKMISLDLPAQGVAAEA